MQDFDGGPCCLQIDCLIQRGYFPVEDERLKGTMLLSPVQDVLPVLVDTPESVAIAHAVSTGGGCLHKAYGVDQIAILSFPGPKSDFNRFS